MQQGKLLSVKGLRNKKTSWRKNANTIIVWRTYGACGVRFNINKINLRTSLEVKFLGPQSTQDSIFLNEESTEWNHREN